MLQERTNKVERNQKLLNKVECKAEQSLLKPDVTDKTHNTLNNFIPSQNTMKILSTADV